MYKFLIQTIDNRIKHDFSLELLNAIEYYDWLEVGHNQYSYELTDEPETHCNYKTIPVGTVEFVLEYIKMYHGINNVEPINIPIELMKEEYLRRFADIVGFPTDTVYNKRKFVKDNLKIKGFTDYILEETTIPAGEYLISDYIDILSEWRIFVYHNKIVGVSNYSGDCTIFPNIGTVNNMIKDFNYNHPYTLDVGITEQGLYTCIIECHDFFSCGLYGFSNYKILPQMFIHSFNKIIGR